MIGYIYKTTNTLNDKIYIGQHLHFTFDKYYKGSGLILVNAFKKYGKENFKCELLEECDSLEEMNYKEAYYINLYNSTDPNIGYNIKPGGNNANQSEETKRKISDRLVGKKKSLSARQNMSLSKIGNTNNNQCNKGRIWVHNNFEEKLIHKDLLVNFDGYVIGRLPKTEKQINHYRDSFKNKIWVNNNEEEHWIDKSELNNFINLGYTIGKLAYSKSRCLAISNGKKDAHRYIENNKITYRK